MTLWHKPTEKPRGKWKLILMQFDSKNYVLDISAIYPKNESVVSKWCYLSDLLKLERENKKLKKKLKELKND